MKSIKIAAAIIRQDNLTLAVRKESGKFPGKWRFPCVRITSGEGPEEALINYIKEELGADICVNRLFSHAAYNYPDFHLIMRCFLCTLLSDASSLHKNQNVRLLNSKELDESSWLPANCGTIRQLKELSPTLPPENL